jgi:probable addiction module antidote protein
MEWQMKKESFSRFDAAEYLESEADIAAYLEAASQDGNPKVLMAAIGDVIRARNLSKIARDSGITREGLYKAFSPDGNPSFSTVVKVAKALDLSVTFRVQEPPGTYLRASQSKRSSAKAHKNPRTTTRVPKR